MTDGKATYPWASAAPTVVFGGYRLYPARRLVEADGVSVPIGGRAMDILIALASRPYEVITHNELIDRVWPDTVADGGNLRFHITALRKALGEGRGAPRCVISVQGRGYCFVPPADSAPVAQRPAPSVVQPGRARGGALPPELRRMVGGAEAVAQVSARVVVDRFVTLVGPGGIGKTAVAVAAAHAIEGQFDDVSFIDLGALQSDLPAPQALASAFGLMGQAGAPTAAIVSFLRDRRVLLVLDCCEPVIEAAAAMAEAIHLFAPAVAILATSREPLRVDGEHVLRLAPLATPPADVDLDWATAHTYAAVELFAERALAGGAIFRRDAAEVRDIADICRRLDGLALAIEIAAGQVVGHGLAGVRDLLAQNFNLLLPGRRTATPRHRTLEATLAWSYDLLTLAEQAVLRRLSIFTGAFDLEMARTVAVGVDLSDAGAVDAVGGLVAKSLVTVMPSETATRYRLLAATRTYGLGKLHATAEAMETARRHAELLHRRWADARQPTPAVQEGDTQAPRAAGRFLSA